MLADQVLRIDAEQVVTNAAEMIRRIVLRDFHRRGAVVAMSGGIDSSVVAALCVQALGRERVVGLFLPERDSSDDSLRLGRLAADMLGINACTIDVTPALEALGCYHYRDEAIRRVFPTFGQGWRCKIVLPPVGEGSRYSLFDLVVQSPEGDVHRARPGLKEYLQIVAASNMKQRTRKLLEYYHAERLNYAVAGTPNRLEHDQGFFVKYGDGAADFKPIAHLYKTQVYALASFLGVPDEICRRPPTTDTYSMPQSQEEFFFTLPYDKMDLCLWSHDHNLLAEEVAAMVGLSTAQVAQVYQDIEAKRRAARYLHAVPALVERVAIPGGFEINDHANYGADQVILE